MVSYFVAVYFVAFSASEDYLSFANSNISLTIIWFLSLVGIVCYWSYFFTAYKPLNGIQKALILICITIVFMFCGQLIAGTSGMTLLSTIDNISIPLRIVMFVALKAAFCMQITALIIEPYLLNKKWNNFKATKQEFHFVETIICSLVVCSAYGYFFAEHYDLRLMLNILQGYLIAKLATTLQTKALSTIKGVQR
jgi:hypothetical protein